MAEKPLRESEEKVQDGETAAFEKDYDAFWGKGSSRRGSRLLRTLGDTPPYISRNDSTRRKVLRTLGDTPLIPGLADKHREEGE